MTILAELLLALAVRAVPPGYSPYSLEPAAGCGVDPKQPTCELLPTCKELTRRCEPPRYSPARKAWVRVESKARGLERYRRITQSLARVATQLTSCSPEEEHCIAPEWPSGSEQLALVGLTVALHESGLREDIQFGQPPLGRGSLGEACLIQVMTDQAPKYASWLSKKEQGRILASSKAQERFAETLLGDSPKALDRCFEIGLRMLVRARRACRTKSVAWQHGMFAMYGSGHTCRLPSVANKRVRTLAYLEERAIAEKKKLIEAVPARAPTEHEPEAKRQRTR